MQMNRKTWAAAGVILIGSGRVHRRGRRITGGQGWRIKPRRHIDAGHG